MNTENSESAGSGHIGKTPEDEGAALSRKLSGALKENSALRDRLAELDISMHIETVELKKDIEKLERERDEFAKENEFLLEDYTAKDHKIQELLRQIEIKQLMINETSSYLSTATDRIKNLERQCSDLEAHYAEICSDRTASEKIDEETLTDDGPGTRNALIEDIRKEFEESLGQKDLEIETLHRSMEKLREQNKFLSEEKAEFSKDAGKRISHLESALTQERMVRADLEDTMQRKDMVLQELHEHFISDTERLQTETAGAREAAERAEDEIRRLETTSAHSKADIAALNEQIAEQQRFGETKSREAAELTGKCIRLEEDYQRLIKTSEAEISSFQNIISLRGRELAALTCQKEELEAELSNVVSALTQQKDLMALAEKTPLQHEEISRLRQDNEALSAKLQTETAGAREAAERAEDEIRRLETISARSKADIAALNEQIAEQQRFGETKSREVKELTEKSIRLEEDRQRLIKTSEAEISALQNIISLRGRELEASTRRKEELEEELSNAAGVMAQQKDLMALAEKTPLQHEEINRLRQDNEALSARLAEALHETATLEDIKTAISLEIKRLSEKMELLKDERMADRVTLKNDIDKSFSMVAESTERLEHAIAEGLPLARRLEEISSGMVREALPAVYTAVPHEPEKTRSNVRGRQLVAAVGLLLLLVMTAAIFFRQDVYHALSEKGLFATAPKATSWETGTKQAKSGQYEATLTFLNKEAVQVLGFSDIIPEASLTHNTFALIEIRSIDGCIPEDFVASPEKNISFLDDQGAATPLNDPGALSGWKKTIYKQNACLNKKAGAVYMKHIISAEKKSSIRGLAVRGLAADPIILR